LGQGNYPEEGPSWSDFWRQEIPFTERASISSEIDNATEVRL